MRQGLSLGRLRHGIRSLIDVHPGLYLPIYRIRSKTRDITVQKDTELVIEGYPRSANTFSVAAFTFAQERSVKIARHFHAPAQVIAAVRKGIPCVVLIRNPRDAVLSLLIREPHISAEQALKDYIQVNTRFGINFKPFEHTEENLQKAFQIVEEMDKQDTSLSEVKEETVAQPSAYLEELKKRAEAKLETPKTKRLLLEAVEVYRMFSKGRESLCAS